MIQEIKIPFYFITGNHYEDKEEMSRLIGELDNCHSWEQFLNIRSKFVPYREMCLIDLQRTNAAQQEALGRLICNPELRNVYQSSMNLHLTVLKTELKKQENLIFNQPLVMGKFENKEFNNLYFSAN